MKFFQKRDKLLHTYCKTADKDSIVSQIIYGEYKMVRNEPTKIKRDKKSITIINILKQTKI